MTKTTAHPFSLRLPSYGVAGATIIFLSLILFGNDLGPFLLSSLLAMIVILCLAIVFFRRLKSQTAAAFVMLILFCTAFEGLRRVSNELHNTDRWLLHSREYKARIFAQTNTGGPELKHVEWDGWGFPGAGDTVTYLVFDPSDSLLSAAQSHSAGKFSGIPCEVPQVKQMESHWYTVLFYTDTDWEHCG